MTLERTEMIPFVGLAVIALLGWSANWYLSHLHERRRRATLARFAASRGWSFVAEDDSWAGIAGDEPFGEGHSLQARYVMRGQYGGLASVVFEYRWVTGWGRQREAHGAGVYALGLPVDLPGVHIRSEYLMDTAARLLGAQDIELESEEFNRAFRVRATDARFAYDLLNPRTMEALLSAQDLVVQISHCYLVATLGVALNQERADHTLALLAGMVERLPGFVWTDRGQAPPQVRLRPA